MFGKKGCYIIAEIGGNFKDYKTAVKMIDQAKEAGADAVKLQTYKADTITAKGAMFNQENTGICSQYEYFKQYEISEELNKDVFSYAQKVDIDCFSTPSHISDVEMLERLGMDIYKIGADDATNYPFLRKIAELGKPIILSTGMCTIEEVKEAVKVIEETGNRKLSILHTVGNYPTYPEQVNLSVIKTFQRIFPDYTIGYSDHTLNVNACIYAAVLGAQIIEKHFTYDKNADGPDHMLSATKEELKFMIERIREFEKMRGDGIKRPVGEEILDRELSRKSLVVIDKMNAGDTLTMKNIDIKRPGSGIEPKYLNEVIGKKVNSDLNEDTILSWELLK